MEEVISMLWVFFITFYFGIGAIVLFAIDILNRRFIMLGDRPSKKVVARITTVVAWPVVVIIYIINH